MPEPEPLPCVCTTVRKAGRALMRHYEAAVAGTGVSITQFALLRALERNAPMPLSELAGTLVMERTSLYRTLEPLLKSGAVTVVPSGHGRAKIADLTEQGRALIADVLPHWQAAQNHLLGHVGKKQWLQVADLLIDIPTMLEQSA